jgi:hypothetical protein
LFGRGQLGPQILEAGERLLCVRDARLGFLESKLGRQGSLGRSACRHLELTAATLDRRRLHPSVGQHSLGFHPFRGGVFCGRLVRGDRSSLLGRVALCGSERVPRAGKLVVQGRQFDLARFELTPVPSQPFSRTGDQRIEPS